MRANPLLGKMKICISCSIVVCLVQVRVLVPVLNELLVLYYTEFRNYFDHIAHSKPSKRQHNRVQQPLEHANHRFEIYF